MKKLTWTLMAILVAAGAAVPAMAANSVAVTNAAALEGNFGLAVDITGGSNLTDAYVVTAHPDGETTYNFSFRLHPGTLNMDAAAAARSFIIGNVRKLTPNRNFLFVYLMEQRNGWWGVQANARNDNGAFPAWQTPVNVCNPSPSSAVPCSSIDGTGVEIRYEWGAATAPGANNGFFRVYRNGVLARTFANLDNDLQTIEEAWWGAIFMGGGTQNSPSTQADGTYYFDSYESTR